MSISLRTKFLVVFVVTVIVAIGLAGLLANRATVSQFASYLEERSEACNRKIETTVADFYVQSGTLRGSQEVVDQMSKAFDARIIVVDGTNRVVADSGRESETTPVSLDLTSFTARTIVINGAPVGAVLISPLPGRQYLTSPEVAFLGAVNRYLVLGAVLAGLSALMVGFFLAQRVTVPLRSMTVAAREMAAGNLDQRVAVKSKDEIADLGNAFNAMADSLAKTQRLRRNMVADIAHELRTPLTTIQGYLEGLRDGVIAPTPGNLGSLHEETVMLSRLVSDLQELSLADAGELALHREPTDLEALVKSEAKKLKRALAQKKLHFKVDFADVPPADVDAQRIAQVVRNLVNNSAKATPQGGLITARGRRNGRFAEITVADTGSGIAAEDLPHIFERFYRADRSRNRSSGGSGVGLAIAKRLVEAHGGTITARSTPGQGADVTFTVPLAHGHGAARPVPPAATARAL